jgi:hypothetical protein
VTARARFSQADVTRAFRAAKTAGFSHVRVGIDVQGNIVVDASDVTVIPDRRNPLDRLLAS